MGGVSAQEEPVICLETTLCLKYVIIIIIIIIIVVVVVVVF